MEITEPAFPPARALAPRLHAQFARRHAESGPEQRGKPGAAADPAVIEALIEAGFWASLRREEGRSPKISLAYLPPAQAGNALIFDRPLPLSTRALTHLAPAVERRGIHLGVWGADGDLHVWGATRTLPHLCFVLEVADPGLLVVKYSRQDEFSKFGNVAVIEGDRIRVVDQARISHPDCPRLLSALAGINRSGSRPDTTGVLVQLALSMRAHGHGGALLVVPDGTTRWEKSIVSPVSYRAAPPFSHLGELTLHDRHDVDGRDWRQAFRLAVDGIGGLTAVDGATVIDDRYVLLAFGAKIDRMEGSTTVRELVIMEPVDGHIPERVDAAEIGGMRHLSAAQFVHDQRDTVALVASQDGRFTIFAWSAQDERVQAHRIETLLL